jgi:clan AA aspartic protease
MIVGVVAGREALIPVTLHGRRGRKQQIRAVVDTGYTGWLTLPRSVIRDLQLLWQTFGRGVLADGSTSAFDVYQANIVWDGRVRRVFVDAFEGDPLVGMALLRGYEYHMQVRARGKVTITRISGR